MQLHHKNISDRIKLAAKHHLLGKHGFELPKCKNFSVIRVTKKTQLDNIQITTNGRPNYIAFNPQNKLLGSIHVKFARQAQENLFVIGDEVKIDNGEFNFFANHGTFILGDNNKHFNFPRTRIWNDNNLIFFGKDTTSNGLNLSSKSSNILIGEDCMFAPNVWIRNSDEHLIFDLDSLEQINSSGEVIIYPHTWICQDSLILKNTQVGPGSIVGAKSLVIKDVPSFSIVGGNPARILKRNVSWERHDSKIQSATLKRINNYKIYSTPEVKEVIQN